MFYNQFITGSSDADKDPEPVGDAVPGLIHSDLT
jgi:hypothetical protein